MRRREGDIEQSYQGATTATLRPTTWVGGWLSPILVTAFTLIWCFLIYGLIGERPRHWQYGVVPYIPGQSIISLNRTPAGPTPKQVELPR